MRRKDREITVEEEISGILQKAEICRLALSDEGQPYIVALNYGVVNNNGLKFYFHCANEGRKLDIIRKSNKACVQVEVDAVIIKGTTSCSYTMNYRSVVGFGTVEIITDPKERMKGMDAIMLHYSDEKEFNYEEKNFGHTTILRMDITEITGKKKAVSV